jgi:hypothetical protein
MLPSSRRSRRLAGQFRVNMDARERTQSGHDRHAADLVLYSNLFLRYDSNTDLQWRVPATVMTVESFVYLGLVTIQHNNAARWCLAILGALLAVIGAASMRRIELTALADRALLDIYESQLDFRLPTLPHQMRFNSRLDKLKGLQALQDVAPAAAVGSLPAGIFYGSSVNNTIGRSLVWIDRQFVKFPPSLTWFVLMVLTGAGAVVLAALL